MKPVVMETSGEWGIPKWNFCSSRTYWINDSIIYRIPWKLRSPQKNKKQATVSLAQYVGDFKIHVMFQQEKRPWLYSTKIFLRVSTKKMSRKISYRSRCNMHGDAMGYQQINHFQNLQAMQNPQFHWWLAAWLTKPYQNIQCMVYLSTFTIKILQM